MASGANAITTVGMDTPLNITVIAEVDLKARIARQVYGNGGAVLCTPDTDGDRLLPEVARINIDGPAHAGLAHGRGDAPPAEELS